ncbi:MAG TPA: class I SAM-dependent methyltransferase [Pseudonocardiaceae bacterium]|nr:class I SAM-dependent methyltransferase [Pseudonocardiaceae bacterium]
MDDLHARRAASFGYVATEYALHRPDYPDQAVLWALESMSSNGPDGAFNPGTVLDLGAGTGKLTAAIVRCGVAPTRVLAVEPDDEMRAELRRRLPEIAVVSGSAEHIPAEQGAVDAVLVGQAFHWFDRDRALSEIARALRPGGVLAVMGNTEDDSVSWVAELIEATHAVRPIGSTGPGFADVPEHPAFDEPEQRQFCWRWPRTIDSFLATVSTHSWALVSSPEERAAALAAIRRFLEERAATRNGAFELPMRTHVLRTVRRA